MRRGPVGRKAAVGSTAMDSSDSLRWRGPLLAVAMLVACSGEAPTPVDPGPRRVSPAGQDGSELRPEPTVARESEVPPADPVQPQVEVIAPANDPSGSFEEALAQLPKDSDALPEAVALFIARYRGTKAVGATQRADLDALIARVGQARPAADAAVARDPALFAAACASTGKCGAGKPTAAALAWIEEQRKAGITFHYAGEGTVEAAVDHATLAKRLAPVLSQGSAAYLRALMLDDRAMSHFDEDGYGGPLDELVVALTVWEALGQAGAAYRETAQTRGQAIAAAYLSVAVRPSSRDKHPLDSKLRASYAKFLREHGKSSYAPAVRSFSAAMGAVDFEPSRAQLDAAVEAALAVKADTP